MNSIVWYKDDTWHIKSCLLVGFLLGILCLIMTFKWEVKTYYETIGMVQDNQVMILLPITYLEPLLKQNKVIVGKEHYHYKIVKIEEEVQIEKNIFLKQVVLNISLPDELLQEQNTFKITIPLEKKKLFHVIQSCWKEEIND